MVRQPCSSCPWRVDQDARAIPGFRLELAEKLANTCPDERGMGPDWPAPMFACHQSRDGNEIVCAGWLAAVGHKHPLVRLGVAHGEIDQAALDEQPGLHTSFREVIEKLRASNPETESAR